MNSGRLPVDGTFGVVTSTHWIATAIGMRLLEFGGNAFDAAVATTFALQVLEPHLNGAAGEISLLSYHDQSHSLEVTCGQGPAPTAATTSLFRSFGFDHIPGTRLLAACVPGTFDALMLLLLRHGTCRLRDVLVPAIGYAANGYPVALGMTEAIAALGEDRQQEWVATARIYRPEGTVPRPGALHRNPYLADTYGRILREAEQSSQNRDHQIQAARHIWREGFIAEAIDSFCRAHRVTNPATGDRFGGLLSGEDMSRFGATTESALTYNYGRWEIAKCGPWSQGPVMLQQLALLSRLLPEDASPNDVSEPELVHLQVECAKLAFADRDAYYGDPAFVKVPVSVLLSDDFNEERSRLIGPEASMELRPGTVEGYQPRHDSSISPAASLADAGSGEPTFPTPQAPRTDTVHFDIIDRWGNMVSGTPSGGWLGSSPVIPALGFPLGTRLQMFTLEENHPNSLAPGKRPRTTLSPSIAFCDGLPHMCWGTPGGDNQDQWSTQFFVRYACFGATLQAAADAPSWHTRHLIGSFWPRSADLGLLVMEDTQPIDVIDTLRSRGHRIAIGSSGGLLTAASREGTRRRAVATFRRNIGLAVGR